MRSKEPACTSCNAAHAAYTRRWRGRTGRTESRLYTDAEISEIKAQALRDAADEALFGAYGKGWLRDRAAQVQSQPGVAA